MIARGGPPRREALINLAREPNPTRENGVGTREVEEVVEETAKRRRGGGREAEDDSGGALSPGDRRQDRGQRAETVIAEVRQL